VPVAALCELPEERECVDERERALDPLAARALLPGKACAATSASRPVSATLAAISQRFRRVSLRSAASRRWVLCSRIWRRMGTLRMGIDRSQSAQRG